MIKLSIQEILDIAPALKDILHIKFNGVISFKIARISREIDKELELFDETRRKLVEEFASRDENGEIILVDNCATVDDIESFNKAMKEVVSQEININAEKIPSNLFDEIEIEPSVVYQLYPIIKW